MEITRIEHGHYTDGFALVDPENPDDGERVDYRPRHDTYYFSDGFHSTGVSAELIDALVDEVLKQRGMMAVPLTTWEDESPKQIAVTVRQLMSND